MYIISAVKYNGLRAGRLVLMQKHCDHACVLFHNDT
jgi:hypothetical protein